MKYVTRNSRDVFISFKFQPATIICKNQSIPIQFIFLVVVIISLNRWKLYRYLICCCPIPSCALGRDKPLLWKFLSCGNRTQYMPWYWCLLHLVYYKSNFKYFYTEPQKLQCFVSHQYYQFHSLTRHFGLHSPGRRRIRRIWEYIGAAERTETPRPPFDNHAELLKLDRK